MSWDDKNNQYQEGLYEMNPGEITRLKKEKKLTSIRALAREIEPDNIDNFVKTLHRMDVGKGKVQSVTLNKLVKKLGLPKNYFYTQDLIDKQITFNLYDDFAAVESSFPKKIKVIEGEK